MTKFFLHRWKQREIAQRQIPLVYSHLGAVTGPLVYSHLGAVTGPLVYSHLGAVTGRLVYSHLGAVSGPLTVHSTLTRHLYMMGLTDSPVCGRCGEEEETSALLVLCECEALATLRRTYLGSLFLDRKGIRSLRVGAIWHLLKGQGCHDLDFSLRATRSL
jgi:hypothetical protein